MGILSTIASLGGSLVSGLYSSNQAGKAAKAQTQAQLAGIESQERMFNRALELQQPYRDAGYGAITGLQGMLGADNRANMLTDYYNSQEFQGYQAQAEEAALRNAAATGNLRSGSTQTALATIAPQLGASYLNSQQNILTGLGNWGMGAAAQGASQAQALGSGIAQQQSNIGDISAQNALTQANIFGSTMGQLTGLINNQWG